MKKAFAYYRKSIERDSLKSIERQRDSVEAYAKENKIEIVSHYEEVASSATLSRKELQRMLRDLEDRTDIDFILVDSFDRISREMDHFGWILSQLKEIMKSKARLHSCTEDNDYEDDHYKLFVIMLKTFGATEERIRIVERMQNARINKKKKGGFIGGMPPFGYRAVMASGKLFVNEPEVPVVKKVFELREKKMSMEKVAIELNRLGYKTRKGMEFKPMTVQRIVKHKDLYLGKMQAPAIIDSEELALVK